MKLHLIFISFLLLFQSAHAQAEKKENDIISTDVRIVSLEPVYFVLGTLNDYNGRFHSVGKGKQVDKYYPYEKPLVSYLTGYIRTELDITVDTIFEKSNYIRMYSDELSKLLNDLYGVDERLQTDTFKTPHQIYSFLAGVYYRYGEKLDSSIYKIQIANSWKPRLCDELLKQIGCENTNYRYLQNIPAQFIVYFEPTNTLKQYLNFVETERLIHRALYDHQIGQMMKGYMTREDIEKKKYILRKEEVQSIKNTFIK